MAYPKEYKEKIIQRMKADKISDIAKDTGISIGTLYNWRLEQCNIKEKTQKTQQSQSVMEKNILDDSNNLKNTRNDISMDITKVTKKPEKDTTIESQKTRTIQQTISGSMKRMIQEIYNKYYVGMQNINTQSKYIKRYDKLQILLTKESTDKRAQMELMLVLINEGYKEEIKNQFPAKDYDYINNIISQYNSKKKSAKEAINDIDEYCV